MFYCVSATVFAQVVITMRFVPTSSLPYVNRSRVLRVYAIAGNNRLVASYLFFVTIAQFAFGIYLTVRFALRPGMSVFLCL